MPSFYCHLCYDEILLKSPVSFTPPATKDLRHAKDLRALPPGTKGKYVQERLRQDAEPPYPVSNDELETRARGLFARQFIRFFRPARNLCSPLPAEMLAMLASAIFRSPFADRLMLEDSTAKALGFSEHKSMPNSPRSATLNLSADVSLHLQSRVFAGTKYITAISVSSAAPASPDMKVIKLDSKKAWTYLVLTSDVSGCIAVYLYTGEPVRSRFGRWYRVFSRKDLLSTGSADFIARYQGRTLMDITSASRPCAALFDSLPSPSQILTAWYHESILGRTSSLPRMRKHQVPAKVIGISMAFRGGTTLDFHL